MDRRGIAGPFEDLPSLLVVIVATGLFLSVAVRAVVIQQESREASERDARAMRLLRGAMALDCLTEGEGLIDLRNARGATAKDIEAAMGWLGKGWKLNVSWIGEGGAPGWLEWASGEPSGDRASVQAPVVVDTGIRVPGRMTAVVWDA